MQTESPQPAELDPERWQTVLHLAETWCEQECLPSIGLIVGSGKQTTGVHLYGRQRIGRPEEPIRDDAIFLVASITKPLVATGVMLLVERGELVLGDRVGHFVPEFATSGKNGITLRHLLTHTSGLPDMLPNNRQLRADHAPLETFVEETCRVEPEFPPGRGVQYQSMGFAVLGEVIGRVTGQTCRSFLHQELFAPLGMDDTALGAGEDWFTGEAPKAERIAEIRLPDEQEGTDWGWNSRYWRCLGAPWGGLLTTPADLARFARMMLNDGAAGTRRVLSRATVAAMTRNQLAGMRGIPQEDRRCKPWGLGWRLNWPDHSANFGDLTGAETYGHWGATGTVLWIDPGRHSFAIILSTQPQEPRGSYLARLSNAIAASLP